MDPNYIAIEFLCPVCNTLPIGAVLAEDGFLYDRGCIEQYFHNDHIRSPMTGQLMGKTLFTSPLVDDTVNRLVECDGLDPSFMKKKTADTSIEGTVCIDEIVALAQSYLFDEQHQSTDIDKSNFYRLVQRAAAKDDPTGKVFQGICLIRGIGERDWSEGFELLVDVASQEESSGAKDLALYTLGMCYERGVFGFKKSKVKGRKWLDRVESVPSFVTDYWDDSVEDPGDILLFGDVNARSTASTVTSLTTDLTERRCAERRCAECVRNDSFGLQCCISCKEKEFDRLLFDV